MCLLCDNPTAFFGLKNDNEPTGGKRVFKNIFTEIQPEVFLKAQNPEDLHMHVPKGIDIDVILCIKMDRTVRNDNTISYRKQLYQIEEVMSGKTVMVTERVSGTMDILYGTRT